MPSLPEHVLLRERDKCTSNRETWSKVAQRNERARVALGVRVGFVEKLVRDGPSRIPSITNQEKGF